MGKERSLRITRPQLDYLAELVEDDIEFTELTDEEFKIADAALTRLEALQDRWERTNAG